jgi:hypothetical protein
MRGPPLLLALLLPAAAASAEPLETYNNRLQQIWLEPIS